MLFAASLAFYILLAVNILTFRRLSHPGVVHSLLWALVFSGYALDIMEFDRISGNTVAILVCGSISFYLGCVFVNGHVRNKQVLVVERQEAVRKRTIFAILLLIVSITGLPFMLQEARRLYEASGMDAFLVGVRYIISETDEGASYRIFGYLHAFNIVALSIFSIERYREKSKINTLLFLVSFIVAMCYGILLTGRTFLFETIVVSLFPPLLMGRVGTLKLSVILVAFFLTIFSLVGILLGKGGDVTNSIGDNLRSIPESLVALYLLSPIPALDTIVSSPDSLGFGFYTFRSVLAVGKALGFVDDVPRLIQEFVFVPVPVNVYTVYSVYFKDFGYIGAITAPALFGAIHTWTYKKALSADPFYIALCSFLFYPLLMQTFEDQYFSLMSGWIQRVLLLWIAYRLVSRVVFKKTASMSRA